MTGPNFTYWLSAFMVIPFKSNRPYIKALLLKHFLFFLNHVDDQSLAEKKLSLFGCDS